MSICSWKLSKRGERRNPSFIRQLGNYLRIPGMVSLGGGLPSPSLNPLQGLTLTLDNESTIAIPEEVLKNTCAYVPTLGFEPLRQWIRDYMHYEHRYPHPENDWEFLIGNGSQDLLQRIFDIILDPYDTLLVEEYTYPGALAAVWPIGCQIKSVKMDEFGLIPTRLLEVLENWNTELGPLPKALYIVPIAQNPTGTSLPTERKEEIYKIASRFNLIIIEDDPYWNLDFTEYNEDLKSTLKKSFWSMDVDQRVIRLESLSKVTATGFRVGWACGAKEVIEKVGFDLESGAQSGSALSQLAVYEMVSRLASPTDRSMWKAYVNHITKSYSEKCKTLENALKLHLIELAEWTTPGGGLFIWVKLKGLNDSEEFVRSLAENNLVLTVPGIAFTCDRSPSPYIRLAFSYIDVNSFEPAIKKLADALRAWTSKK